MGPRWAIMLFDSSSVSVHDSVCVFASCEVTRGGQRGWLKNKLISRPGRWETGAQISREIKMLVAAGHWPLLSRWPLLINFYVVIISFQGCGLPLPGRDVISSPLLTNYSVKVKCLLMWRPCEDDDGAGDCWLYLSAIVTADVTSEVVFILHQIAESPAHILMSKTSRC